MIGTIADSTTPAQWIEYSTQQNILDGLITVDAIRRMWIARVTAEMALSSGFQSCP